MGIEEEVQVKDKNNLSNKIIAEIFYNLEKALSRTGNF
jgi:hypothetical protein